MNSPPEQLRNRQGVSDDRSKWYILESEMGVFLRDAEKLGKPFDDGARVSRLKKAYVSADVPGEGFTGDQ